MNKEREYIEFFKMFNTMNEVGQVSIISNGFGQYCACTLGKSYLLDSYEAVQIDMNVETALVEWFDTPYEAMKFCYMGEFLGHSETENVTFDLDEDLLEKLYELADEEGVPVDELVCEILRDAIEE